jgi:hypothetical protein
VKVALWLAIAFSVASTESIAQCSEKRVGYGIGTTMPRWHGLARNTRVRLIAPSVRRDAFVGRIDDVVRDSVRLDTSAVQRRVSFDNGTVLVDELRCVTLANAEVAHVDVSRGRAHLKTTMIGLVTGGLGVGVFSGLMVRNDQTTAPNSSFADGFRSGVPLGALVGGVIGYLWGRERWTRVR